MGDNGDVVIGRVVEIMNKKWKIDLQCYDYGYLHINAIMLEDAQRRKTEEDEQRMREYLDIGDLVLCEIKSVSKVDFNVSLHIRHESFGKLGNGLLIPVNSCLIKRMNKHIIDMKGLEFVFALNGFIWISTKDKQYDVELYERIARYRNIIRILDDSMIPVTPKFLFAIYDRFKEVKAKDLILLENKEKIIDAIKTVLFDNN